MQKTQKLVVTVEYIYLKLYVVKHIKIHLSLIVAWPKPTVAAPHAKPMAYIDVDEKNIN